MSMPSLFDSHQDDAPHADDDMYPSVSRVSPLSSREIDRAFMPYAPQSPYISKKYGLAPRPKYARSARFQGPYH